jgi:mycothiol synthase
MTGITHRPILSDEDFWRVRDLLVATYPSTPLHWNWEVRRWDGTRFHSEDIGPGGEWTRGIELWESDDGHLVGVAHPDGPGVGAMQLHPDHRDLEEEMVVWAEEHLRGPRRDGDGMRLVWSVFDYDTPRRRLLERRGYQPTGRWEAARRLRFGGATLPEPFPVDGYTIATSRPDDESLFQRMADLLNAAFGRSIHTAREYRTFVDHSPSFDHGLNVVAEAEDGSLAGHVGVTLEEVNRYAVIEPVCTHPAHRRPGLAISMMRTAIHLARERGAVEIHVDSGDPPGPNLLYDTVGFTEKHVARVMEKRFD